MGVEAIMVTKTDLDTQIAEECKVTSIETREGEPPRICLTRDEAVALAKQLQTMAKKVERHNDPTFAIRLFEEKLKPGDSAYLGHRLHLIATWE